MSRSAQALRLPRAHDTLPATLDHLVAGMRPVQSGPKRAAPFPLERTVGMSLHQGFEYVK
jgi:hypothetical protein